ncbi:hypothetical protein LZ575_15680 [Antarcticibacterium sp. 1MA-6-2]|uniref:hypothetical protein n=1 Tax=Antarcticibacterium sp. 1MA-6-2 TaxID=2908210 RepID=UPI001F487631|nr:hypothetical protein [Antarcticibacterium sp. 1MA-6-2]UJH90288.1 hypothetical protein LZ575_15680 [Antarcticibacterium sp. 1MA-6-2]
MENGSLNENYFTTRADCKACIGKSHKKKDQHHRIRGRITAEYQTGKKKAWPLYEWQVTKHHRNCFGTLKEFAGLRKVNAIGIRQATHVCTWPQLHITSRST